MQTDIQADILGDVYEKPKVAPIFKRIVAAMFVDFTVLALIGFVLGYFWGDRYTTEEGSVGFHLQGLPAFLWFVAWFFLIPFSEGMTGQTLGKRLLNIQVIKLDMSPTTVGTSLVRHLFDMVDNMFLIGLIIAVTNKHRRRIGDLVAGTYIVEKTIAPASLS